MAYSMVVFEGPDNAGKSTLAKMVAEKLDFNYRGRITRVGPALVKQVNVRDFERDGNWILDRCYWLSDTIYETLRGDVSKFKTLEATSYIGNNILYVHVTCDPAAIKERLAMRGDDLWNLEEILKAKAGYDKFFKDNNILNYIEIDTTSISPEDNVQTIIDRIEGDI